MNEKDFKEENLNEEMVWKVVRKWIPGKYVVRNGRRVHIRGHFRRVRIWVPRRRR